jgi:hypothetical protein
LLVLLLDQLIGDRRRFENGVDRRVRLAPVLMLVVLVIVAGVASISHKAAGSKKRLGVLLSHHETNAAADEIRRHGLPCRSEVLVCQRF